MESLFVGRMQDAGNLCLLYHSGVVEAVLPVSQIWGEEALQFQEKLLNSSGLGDETYFPDSEALRVHSPCACSYRTGIVLTRCACTELVSSWRQSLKLLQISASICQQWQKNSHIATPRLYLDGTCIAGWAGCKGRGLS